MPEPIKLLLLCAGVLIPTWVQSLTLGNLNGSVLIGRPLNLTVPVRMDPGTASVPQCVQVDVFHAENRLDRSLVQTSWLSLDTKTDSGILKILTTVPVDEPVVSLSVRAGCGDKTERKYVLLADMPSDLPGAAVALANGGQIERETRTGIDAPVPTSSPALAPRTSPASTSAVASSANTASAVALAPVAKSRPPVGATAPSLPGKDSSGPATPIQRPLKPATAVTAVQRQNPEAKPRLTLDAPPENIELSLKASRNLVIASEDGGQARAEAKALWLILNTPPEQLSVEASRLQMLEAQVKTLQSSAAKSQAEQTRLQSELAKAEDERYMNGVIGLLAVLFVGGLSTAGYFWFRTGRSRPAFRLDWWRKRDGGPSLLGGLAGKSALSERGSGRSGRASIAPDVDLSVFDSVLDNDAVHRHPVVSDSVPPSERYDSAPMPSGFFNSTMGSRALNVEELFDVQQQAEFFVSLGQHEQAIDLLRNHIASTPGTSGVAYLDLLHLLYKFDRRPEFDRLRDEFNFSFNAEVPTFDKFAQFERNRRGIERYPAAISRIESLWKTPEILGLLEQYIFRKPEAGDTEMFDLEAYRELLLLFAIANETQANPGSLTGREGRASIMGIDGFDGLLANPRSVSGSLTTLDSLSPPFGTGGGADLDLDVDLFALEGPEPATSGQAATAGERVLEALDFSLSLPGSMTEAEAKAEAEVDAEASSIELEISKFLEDKNSSLNFTDSDLAPAVKKP